MDKELKEVLKTLKDAIDEEGSFTLPPKQTEAFFSWLGELICAYQANLAFLERIANAGKEGKDEGGKDE